RRSRRREARHRDGFAARNSRARRPGRPMTGERFFGRLLGADEAVAWREALRAKNRVVVFTNGCFDVLHAGHVEYLAWARSQGDALIVGLNDDESVRRIKGQARPIVAFEQRARILVGLRSVDV